MLHVLGSLNRGGIETWLIDVFHRIDRSQVQLDFLCLNGTPGFYAPAVAELGGKVHCIRLTSDLLHFNAYFSSLLARERYDVVHSHIHHFSGYVLWRAARAGIRGRIAQSVTAPLVIAESAPRRAYLAVMKFLIRRYATLGLGNSSASMRSLFTDAWREDRRWRLMFLGTDISRFRQPVNRAQVRKHFGIPAHAMVIGHVGRLSEAKNHTFLLDVMAELERRRDDIWCVVVGEGPLRSAIETYARQKGISRLLLTGGVEETRSLYGLMDLFVFPSKWEGLPQAVIEAQAAGLRCLCSDVVTPEVAVVPDAVVFRRLDDGPDRWAEVCTELLDRPPLDRDAAVAAVAESSFSIERSVTSLMQVYESAQGR